MKKKSILIYITNKVDLKARKFSKFYRLFLRLILYSFKFYLSSKKMRRQLINVPETANESIWCLERILRSDHHFRSQGNIPWAIFVTLALKYDIKHSESWGIFWPCKIGVNVNGSTLLTKSAKNLTAEQRSILSKIVNYHNAELIFIDEFDFFLIRFHQQNLEFSTFLPEVNHIYLRPKLANGKNGQRWLEVLTEIEMEWFKAGHAELINSVWAWSINSINHELCLNNHTSSKSNIKQLGSVEDLALHGLALFSEKLLNTVYTALAIHEETELSEPQTLETIRSTRVLFYKKFNEIHKHANSEIYIFRKSYVLHYFKTNDDLKNNKKEAVINDTQIKSNSSIFFPFE